MNLRVSFFLHVLLTQLYFYMRLFSWFVIFFYFVCFLSWFSYLHVFICILFSLQLVNFDIRCGACDLGCVCMVCERRVLNIMESAVRVCSAICVKCAGELSSLSVCFALVILSDTDISAVVSLHSPKSFFFQTALLTQ